MVSVVSFHQHTRAFVAGEKLGDESEAELSASGERASRIVLATPD